MTELDHLTQILALTLGVGWASGINLYAAMSMLGIAGATGNIALPPDLIVLQNPLVIGAAAFMYCVEFFVDKTPGADSAWDALHTFIRIPAGALLAAGAVGEVTPALQIAAGLLGGGLATTSHVAKTGSRLLINTSPEPVTNWTASVAEDVAVFGGLWAALYHPWLFLALFALFVALLAWLLPKIWRGLRRIGGGIRTLFRRPPQARAGDRPAPPAPD
jgi:hypothetical protein